MNCSEGIPGDTTGPSSTMISNTTSISTIAYWQRLIPNTVIRDVFRADLAEGRQGLDA